MEESNVKKDKFAALSSLEITEFVCKLEPASNLPRRMLPCLCELECGLHSFRVFRASRNVERREARG